MGTSLVVAQEKIYSMLLIVFRNDTVILKSFSVETGLQSHFPTTDTGYYVEILTYENKRLFRANLGISFSIHLMLLSKEVSNMETELNEILVLLRLPYFENASKINIYHRDKLIFSYEICEINKICEKEKGETEFNCIDCNVCGNKKCEIFENYTNCCIDCGCPEGLICKNNFCIEERCGNGICESFPPYNENYKNCPKDCPSGSKDNYCDGVVDGRCDPDCKEKEDIDCIKPISAWVYFLIAFIILILLIILIVFSRRSK